MTPEWQVLRAVHEQFRRSAFAICATGEEVAPQLFAVAADEHGIMRRMAVLPEIQTLMASEAGKKRFAVLLPEIVGPHTDLNRRLVRAVGFTPNVFVQINEAWVANQVPGDTRRAGERPDRKEVILIVLHTESGSVCVLHDIVATPQRHAQASPFPEPGDTSQWSGRFTLQGAVAHEGQPKH